MTDNSSTKAILPHVLIFGGVVLVWLGIDPKGWVMCTGFIVYGVTGVIGSIRNRTYKNGLLGILKPVIRILIVAFAVYYLSFGQLFIVLLVLILLDIIVLTKSRTESIGHEETNRNGT